MQNMSKTGEKKAIYCNIEPNIVERKDIYNVMRSCAPYLTLTCIRILE